MYIIISMYVCIYMYIYTYMYMIYIHDLLHGFILLAATWIWPNLAGALCRSFVQESLERSRPGRRCPRFGGSKQKWASIYHHGEMLWDITSHKNRPIGYRSDQNAGLMENIMNHVIFGFTQTQDIGRGYGLHVWGM